MRMFTKIGVTLAAGAVPVLLWAGSANAQQSQSQDTGTGQSQSQSSVTTPPTIPTSSVGGTGTGGSLPRTGANDLMPLAVGGAALGGALAVRRGLRRRGSLI